MSSIRQRTVAAGKLAMYFLELGYIPSPDEYKFSSGVPLRWATLRTYYKNWNNMLKMMESYQPDLWKELQKLGNKQKPKVEEPEKPKIKIEVKPTKVEAEKE